MGNSNSTGTPKLGSSTTTEIACLNADLSGKLAIVTGCSAGIGVATVTQLLKQGCTVVMANRNAEKSSKAKAAILEDLKSFKSNTNVATTAKTEADVDAKADANVDEKKEEKSQENINFDERIILLTLDLSSLRSVHDFVGAFLDLKLPQTLSLLVNNAGIMAVEKFQVSKENLEMQFATNFIGHFYLTELLINHIEKTLAASCESNGKEAESRHNLRIVNVSSSAHGMAPKMGPIIESGLKRKDGPSEDSYSPWGNYGISKALNILYARHVAEKYSNLKHLNVESFSLHPGVIQTELQRHLPQYQQKGFNWFGGAFLKSVSQGAATTIYLCCEDSAKLSNGSYYADCNLADAKLNKQLKRSDESRELAKNAWEWGQLLVQTKGYPLEFGGKIEVPVEEEKKDSVTENDDAAVPKDAPKEDAVAAEVTKDEKDVAVTEEPEADATGAKDATDEAEEAGYDKAKDAEQNNDDAEHGG